jgi:putative restriction endonuclease
MALAVPFSSPDGVIEHSVLNEGGRISGRAQAAVRPISFDDFRRIVDLGLDEGTSILPRVGTPTDRIGLMEEQAPFLLEQDRSRVNYLGSRIARDRIFRKVVLRAYDERCAFTSLKLINGGGRAEAEAAHIRPVEANGPDIINNGIALSGTAHWMFDRGLISLGDNLEILISRHVNDFDGVKSLLNKSGYARAPSRATDRPHPHFLRWHRENWFKQ